MAKKKPDVQLPAEFISTDDLIAELHNRFVAITFIGCGNKSSESGKEIQCHIAGSKAFLPLMSDILDMHRGAYLNGLLSHGNCRTVTDDRSEHVDNGEE